MLDALILKNIHKQTTGSSSHLRSFVKGITWRIVGTIDTIMIAWLVTGRIHAAVSIGSVEVFTKLLLYYLHERAWEFTRKKKEDKILDGQQ